MAFIALMRKSMTFGEGGAAAAFAALALFSIFVAANAYTSGVRLSCLAICCGERGRSVRDRE